MLKASQNKKFEGWTWLYNSKKYHYFRDSRSLCGRWMLFSVSDLEEEDKIGSVDNCKACENKRKKELSKVTLV